MLSRHHAAQPAWQRVCARPTRHCWLVIEQFAVQPIYCRPDSKWLLAIHITGSAEVQFWLNLSSVIHSTSETSCYLLVASGKPVVSQQIVTKRGFAGFDLCARGPARAGGHVHSLEHGILQGAHVSPEGRWRCREGIEGKAMSTAFVFVHCVCAS